MSANQQSLSLFADLIQPIICTNSRHDFVHPGDGVRDRGRLAGEPDPRAYPIVLVLAGIGLGFAYAWPGLGIEPDLVLASCCLPCCIRRLSTLRGAISVRSCAQSCCSPSAWWRRRRWPWASRSSGWYRSTVGSRIRVGRYRLAAGCSGGDRGAETLSLATPDRDASGGREPGDDATGLVLYRFAVAAALTGTFSGWGLVGQFGLIASVESCSAWRWVGSHPGYRSACTIRCSSSRCR